MSRGTRRIARVRSSLCRAMRDEHGLRALTVESSKWMEWETPASREWKPQALGAPFGKDCPLLQPLCALEEWTVNFG